MTTITVDFGENDFPSIPLIAQELGIEYDDDTGHSSHGNLAFTIDCYPKAKLVRFDCTGDIPDIIFEILLALPPSKALVLIQEHLDDEGFTMKLNDFQTQLMEEE